MPALLGNNHENQIIYYDPGCATLNVGDEIISDSARYHLDPLFKNMFVVRLSTHQGTSFRYRRYLKGSRAGFVLGSNLLKPNMLFGFRQWDISIFDAIQIHDLVLVGCGWQNYGKGVGPYSKILYRCMLSSETIHSVRDDYTKKKLEAIGIRNVINTGCPTMWRLNREFCSRIPSHSASQVVTTLTDYRRDPERDRSMIEQLLSTHDKVYIWLQGSGDFDYISSLSLDDKCIPISPTLGDYDALLDDNEDIEYVGTRLHGGIRALQHGRRTLIISIDNRAREMARDYGIPILEREDIMCLTETIKANRRTEIRLDEVSIYQFLNQFRNL